MKLPVVQGDALDGLEIASPCTVPWDRMKGSPWVRHCDVCKQNVFNLSELTRADALALLERVEGRVCVRFRRRPDGTVVTADCWSRIRAARRRGLLAAAATIVVMLPTLIWAVIEGAANLRAAILPTVDEVQPPVMRMGVARPAPEPEPTYTHGLPTPRRHRRLPPQRLVSDEGVRDFQGGI